MPENLNVQVTPVLLWWWEKDAILNGDCGTMDEDSAAGSLAPYELELQ